MTEQNLDEKILHRSEINSDASEGMQCNSKKRTTIGGQALIEGILMFGPEKTALSVRQADGTIHTEEFSKGKTGGFADKIPVIRGCIRFFRQIVAGMRALMRSADLSENETINSAELSERDAEIKEPEAAVKKESRLDAFLEKHEKAVMPFIALFSILFSVALFILLPRWILDLSVHLIPSLQPTSFGRHMLLTLIEGAIRIIIFLTYLALTSHMKEIARIWMYHGAEHKSIRCYESGEPLTVENIRRYSTRHPRCGTAFLFIIMLVSILVFGIVSAAINYYVGENLFWLNSIVRVLLAPLIAGISYELLRFTGKIDHTPLGRFLTWPGMWLQRFTTREPDDAIIEVAIAVLTSVIPEEKGVDDW